MSSWNPRANEIFLQILELPPEQRQAHLDAACGGDVELRQSVEALLQAHGQAGSFLEKPADAAATAEYTPLGQAGGPTIEHHPEGPGTRIGPYKLLQRLGEGGMGTVYMAEQEHPVRRRVALKIIKAGMDSRHVIARFEQERQALAVMDHPNIAKVLDAGTVPFSIGDFRFSIEEKQKPGLRSQQDLQSKIENQKSAIPGRPYFVMELVKGIPITKYCDQEHLTPQERLQLFIPVCQAVQHAHQKGIIHRDLKPSNVLVALYDGRPVPKVIDFGVAKATGQRLTEQTMFTEMGQMIGTMEYMAPEQAELNNLDIDTRADIYSLGVLLYELLAGSLPFSSKELRSAAFAEMLRMIREVEPSKPSTKLSGSEELPAIAAKRKLEPKRLTRMVHGELDWIVMKCLEKERGRRYGTSSALADDIQHYLDHEPVLAGPPSAVYRLRKFLRRRRGPVLAASLVLLALVAGIIGTTWGMLQAEENRKAEEKQRELAEANEKQANKERDRAEQEKQIAQAVRDFLQTKLLRQASTRFQTYSLLAAGRDSAETKYNPTIRELLDRAATELTPDKIDQVFPGQPEVQGGLLQTIGIAYLGIAVYDQAVTHLKRAHELQQRLGQDSAATIATLTNLAIAYRDYGKVTEAIRLFEEVRDKQVSAGDPELLTTLRNLADAYHAAGKLPEAIRLYEHVRDKLGPEHAHAPAALNNLAGAYKDAGKLPEAIRLFKQVRDERVKKLGLDHVDTLDSLNNLGVAYWQSGRIAEAMGLFEQVVKKDVAVLGPEHPRTLTRMHNLGVAYADAGNVTEAIRLLQEALDKHVAALGPEHPNTVGALNSLAVAYRRARRFEHSVPLFEEALQRRIKVEGPEHFRTFATAFDLGASYQEAGRLGDALKVFDEWLARAAVSLDPGNPIARWGRAQGAVTYFQAGRHDRAESLVREMRAAGEKNKPDGDALAWLGLNLLQQKKPVYAEPVLRECLAIREKMDPDFWSTFNAKSMLGDALLGQKKYAEAEPLLVQGYEGMKEREAKIPPHAKVRLIEALERLVQLYDDWGKPEQAAEWRKKLEAAKGDKPPVKP